MFIHKHNGKNDYRWEGMVNHIKYLSLLSKIASFFFSFFFWDFFKLNNLVLIDN